MSVSFSTIIQKARPAANAATTAAMRDALSRVPPTTVSKIGNGVRVAAEENPNAKFATVGIWVESGSRYDTRHESGLTKVLHHCGLQGTTSADRASIARSIDELGGQLSVESGRERSCIMMKVAKANVDKAVGLMADLVKNARLSAEDVAAAKASVETIRHQSEELIDDVVLDNLHVCAYDASEQGGLGNNVNGTKLGISHVSADSLRAYRDKHITGPRTLLVGSGAVSHEELEAAATRHLGDMSNADNKPAVEARYVGGDYRLWNLRTPMTHAAWGVETSGAVSSDTTIHQLLCHVHGPYERSQHELGNHAMHRLFKTYSNMDFGTPSNTPFPEKAIEITRPFHMSYEDTGLLGMYVVGRQLKTANGMARSMSDILDHSVSDYARMAGKVVEGSELEQAKVSYKAQLMFNMDGSTNSCQDIAKQVSYYGRRIPLEEMFARIDDVNGSNVQEVLQHYFIGRKPVYSLYGYFYPTMGYDVLQLNFNKYFY